MLDPSSDQIQDWGEAVIGLTSEYFAGLRSRKVYGKISSREICGQLDAALPQEGVEFDQLLQVFRETILPFSRHNAHPRVFGYVQSPGTPIAAFADLLASALNANLTAWRSAPAAVEIERLTIDWVRQILGFEPGAGGVFLSGGSMANLCALAVARQTQPDAGGGDLRLYASSETHYSVAKAAALVGIGRENLRTIGVDENFKIRLDELERSITADFAAGHRPFLLVANAGTVNTGAVDPLAEMRALADRHKLWLHIDGSYGAWAILAPAVRRLFSGLALADSVALDSHKWLYLPVDVGCVIYREPEKARATFAHEADYTRVIGHEEASEAFACWDYGPELSRRFRALKVWMLLRGVGLHSLGEAIARNIDCARHLESLVRASADFEIMAPVELSIFCFRHLPPALDGAAPAVVDNFNERLLVALQEDGSSYLSNTMIGGRFALRGCVLNYRTTLRDMEVLLDDLRRVASSLSSRL